MKWQGPGNPRDYLTVVKAGAAERTWGRYEYVSKGNPLALIAPDAPGEYEVRYLSAENNTLARATITVGAGDRHDHGAGSGGRRRRLQGVVEGS